MKRIALALAILIAAPVAASAQASFIIGAILGYAVGSDGKTVKVPGAADNLIWVMPDLPKRIIDSSNFGFFVSRCAVGGGFKAMFPSEIENRFGAGIAPKYEMIAVELPSYLESGCQSHERRTIFFYTANENLRPEKSK